MIALRPRQRLRLTGASLDCAVECCIALCLLFAPLAFGATQAWSQEIVLGLIWAAAALVGLRWLGTPQRMPAASWAIVPILLFLILVVVQLTPLPTWLLWVFSPHTVRNKVALLSDLPPTHGWMPLTFYAWITRQQLRLVLTLAAFFLLILNYFSEPERIRRLLGVISASGLIVTAIALVQNLGPRNLGYVLAVAPHPVSGPFMNHSHFAQFINLSLGAALGLIAVDLVYLLHRYNCFADVFSALCRWRYAPFWIAVIFCVVGPIALFLSMSRGGMVALVIGSLLTAELLYRRGAAGSRTPLAIVLIVLVVVGACCCGSRAVQQRISQAEDFESRRSSWGARLHILHDIGAEVRQFPLLGTGLGTFRVTFPSFNQSQDVLVASYAENEFAQLLVECGVVGVGLAIWFIVLVGISYLSATHKPTRSIQYAAFGLGFGLTAILIQSMFDYGQHVLANALLTAASCALLASLARLARQQGASGAATAALPPPTRAPIALPMRPSAGAAGALALGLLMSAGLLVLIDADRARAGESGWQDAHLDALALEKQNWAGSDASYSQLLAAIQSAASAQPTNATYQYWLNVFRWRAITRSDGVDQPDVELSPQQVALVQRLVEQLRNIPPLCPTFGLPNCLAGQLTAALTGGTRGLSQLQMAQRLAPYDRTVSLALANELAMAHDWDDSLSSARRYVALGGNVEDPMALYLRLNMPELAYVVGQDHRVALLHLAQSLRASHSRQELAQRCDDRANWLLEQEGTRPDAPVEAIIALAEFDRARGKADAAALLYRRALVFDYGQTVWRLRLAQALVDAGRPSEAVRELQVCLRLQPQMAGARALLHRLTNQPPDDL